MTKGLAGMKFSGSARAVGKNSATAVREMRKMQAPNRSLVE